jgi:hypothetical protein
MNRCTGRAVDQRNGSDLVGKDAWARRMDFDPAIDGDAGPCFPKGSRSIK